MTTHIEFTSDRTGEISQSSLQIGKIVEDLSSMSDQLLDDGNATAADSAHVFYLIKEAHAQLDAATKALYKVKDRFDKQIVPAKMDTEGVDMVRIPQLARSFSKQSKMSASFVDKEAGFNWLREIGQDDLIQETVNAGTLSAMVRNLILEEGIEPPEDVVKVNTYNTTGVNKYTPK